MLNESVDWILLINVIPDERAGMSVINRFLWSDLHAVKAAIRSITSNLYIAPQDMLHHELVRLEEFVHMFIHRYNFVN